MTLYVLTYVDLQQRRWFIASGAGLGNLLRTDQPLLARSWKHPVEPGQWILSMTREQRQQLAGLKLFVCPLQVTVGKPIEEMIPITAEALPQRNGRRSKNPEKPTLLFK